MCCCNIQVSKTTFNKMWLTSGQSALLLYNGGTNSATPPLKFGVVDLHKSHHFHIGFRYGPWGAQQNESGKCDKKWGSLLLKYRRDTCNTKQLSYFSRYIIDILFPLVIFVTYCSVHQIDKCMQSWNRIRISFPQVFFFSRLNKDSCSRDDRIAKPPTVRYTYVVYLLLACNQCFRVHKYINPMGDNFTPNALPAKLSIHRR